MRIYLSIQVSNHVFNHSDYGLVGSNLPMTNPLDFSLKPVVVAQIGMIGKKTPQNEMSFGLPLTYFFNPSQNFTALTMFQIYWEQRVSIYHMETNVEELVIDRHLEGILSDEFISDVKEQFSIEVSWSKSSDKQFIANIRAVQSLPFLSGYLDKSELKLFKMTAGINLPISTTFLNANTFDGIGGEGDLKAPEENLSSHLVDLYRPAKSSAFVQEMEVSKTTATCIGLMQGKFFLEMAHLFINENCEHAYFNKVNEDFTEYSDEKLLRSALKALCEPSDLILKEYESTFGESANKMLTDFKRGYRGLYAKENEVLTRVFVPYDPCESRPLVFDMSKLSFRNAARLMDFLFDYDIVHEAVEIISSNCDANSSFWRVFLYETKTGLYRFFAIPRNHEHERLLAVEVVEDGYERECVLDLGDMSVDNLVDCLQSGLAQTIIKPLSKLMPDHGLR